MPKLTQAGLNLIKDFEDGAWRTKKEFRAYVDKIGRGQPVTIGYGYTNAAGYGPGVKIGDVWTKTQAEENLREGAERVGQQILPYLKRTPTDNQYSAMVSFVWNLGIGNFRSSTFLKRFNAGDIEGAAEAMTWFNKSNGKVYDGLVRRRSAEKALFLADKPAPVVSPTPDPVRSTKASSTTLQATGAAGIATVTGAAAAVGSLSETAQIVVIGATVIVVLALAWIARERIKKWAEGDR